MLDQQTLSRLDALRPRLLSRARGGAGGSRKSRMLGASAEFSDYREYTPGDDTRRVDWNAYARFDKLFLKLFMEEQEAFITILIDGSASMREKWPAACQIAQAYAYAALGGGDRVRAGVISGKGVSMRDFAAGRRAFLSLAGFVENCRPEGQADLSAAVRRLSPCPKGLTLLISDFLLNDAGASVLQALSYQRQEICAVQLLSPQELRPNLTGAVRLKDGEGGSVVELTADGDTLRRYEKKLGELRQAVRANCRRHGAPCAFWDTGEEAEKALVRLFLEAGILN